MNVLQWLQTKTRNWTAKEYGIAGMASLGVIGLTSVSVLYHKLSVNYPNFITSDKLPGKHKQIGVEYHRTPQPNSIRFKLYYPASPHPDHANKLEYPKPHRYFTDAESITGLASSLGGNPLDPRTHSLSNWIFASGLKLMGHWINTPQSGKKRPLQCNENMPLVSESHGKYPLIVFSHGLGGSFDVYTQMCMAYASYGFMVACIDHCEGSALYSTLADGTGVSYQHSYLVENDSNDENKKVKYLPKGNVWSRNDLLAFRGPQLKKRVLEYKTLYYFLKNYQKNTENSGNFKHSLLSSIDTSHIWAVGHSYGATTVGASVKELVKEEESNSLRGVIMYDPWAEVLTDEKLKEEYKLPSLILLTQKWLETKSDKFIGLIKLLHNSSEVDATHKGFLVQKGFVHHDCADIPDWAPKGFIENMGFRSKVHARTDVIHLFTKPCIKFIASLDTDLVKNGILEQSCTEYESKHVESMV